MAEDKEKRKELLRQAKRVGRVLAPMVRPMSILSEELQAWEVIKEDWKEAKDGGMTEMYCTGAIDGLAWCAGQMSVSPSENAAKNSSIVNKRDYKPDLILGRNTKEIEAELRAWIKQDDEWKNDVAYGKTAFYVNAMKAVLYWAIGLTDEAPSVNFKKMVKRPAGKIITIN